MEKPGALFEKAVADIIRGFRDVTDVAQGEWRDGPDGRRDRDVTFTVNEAQRPLRALIECKDYDRNRTGRVGIGVIDALDSKRRDLGIDIVIICSNAGFAAPAIRKAQRVGIRTVGALRMGDSRIRLEVRDVIYTRRVTIEDLRAEIILVPGQGVDLSTMPLDQISFGGGLLGDWLIYRAQAFLSMNLVVNGSFRQIGRFKAPVTLTTPKGSVAVTRVDVIFQVSGAWYKHEVAFDATNGLYDWVRGRVQRVPPPGGSDQVQVRGLDAVAGGEWVARPPEKLPYSRAEVDMAFLVIWVTQPKGPMPMLDEFVEREDMQFVVAGPLPAEAVTSKKGYRHPSDQSPRPPLT